MWRAFVLLIFKRNNFDHVAWEDVLLPQKRIFDVEHPIRWSSCSECRYWSHCKNLHTPAKTINLDNIERGEHK
jgi:hypothetical protein